MKITTARLTSCVIFYMDGHEQKTLCIRTYGGNVRVVVGLVAESVHQTRFADIRVAQHEHFERFAGVHVRRTGIAP